MDAALAQVRRPALRHVYSLTARVRSVSQAIEQEQLPPNQKDFDRALVEMIFLGWRRFDEGFF